LTKFNLIKNLAEPLLLRMGSMLSGALIGVGMASEHGPTIQTAVTVVGLVGLELIARKVVRK
jgi:hypothetical protein